MLAAVLAVATDATAGAQGVMAAYVGSCGTDDNYHAYADKSFLIAHAEATVAYFRTVLQCNPFLFSVGTSMVLPVNLQTGQFYLSQLGWTQGDTESTNHFRYTPND